MAGLPSARLWLKELWKARCKAQACLRRPGHENEASANPDAGLVASLLNCANRHGRGRTNRSGVRKVRKWTVARALAHSGRPNGRHRVGFSGISLVLALQRYESSGGGSTATAAVADPKPAAVAPSCCVLAGAVCDILRRRHSGESKRCERIETALATARRPRSASHQYRKRSIGIKISSAVASIFPLALSGRSTRPTLSADLSSARRARFDAVFAATIVSRFTKSGSQDAAYPASRQFKNHQRHNDLDHTVTRKPTKHLELRIASRRRGKPRRQPKSICRSDQKHCGE